MKSKSKAIYLFTLFALAIVFVFSATMLVLYYVQSSKSQATYQDLAALVDAARPTETMQFDSTPDYIADETAPSPFMPVTDLAGNLIHVLREYAPAYQLNPHMVGWLSIDGTNINYPVVQTSDSPDYYLRRDFYGNRDSHGCIYAEEFCDIFKPSDNITLYGHRMRDGTMFAQLSRYENKDFWQTNQTIRFDTLFEHHAYQIAYVFITESSVGEGFQYHTYADFTNETELQAFISQCQSLALYNTDVDIAPGDKLITLSTCDYSVENGRLVIVAKRID